MATALLHHWLVGMRGGEKVLESACNLLPSAEIFTLVCDSDKLSDTLRSRRIHTSFIQQLPFARSKFRAYLPLFPMAAASFDLSNFQLVISLDASLIKCARVPAGIPHICYCHSPPRYLWDMYDFYRSAEAGPLQRLAMPLVAAPLRSADYNAAQRVTHFVANSRAVAARIARHYNRDAEVIYPPIDTAWYAHVDRKPEDFYLFVGQLVAYKRADLAVRALSALGRPLVVVGDGPQRAAIERLARGNIRFTGWITNEQIRDYYARCRALIFPNEEDFGMVPVETMAAGAPVIAFGAGGALETVEDGVTGIFFHEPTPDSLQAAIQVFEQDAARFAPAACRSRARQFDRLVFDEKMRELIARFDRGGHP